MANCPHLVLVDVKVTIHMPITVDAIDTEDAQKLAKTMALAKFEGEYSQLAISASTVTTEIK